MKYQLPKTFINNHLPIAPKLSKIIMSQEPSNDKTNVQKLSIDKPSDFRFHAAYLAYSETWDKTSSPQTKAELNEIITSLSEGKIDTEDFYRKISQYRQGFNSGQYSHFSRTRIETQRKRDWRKREAKNARNSRHRR